MKAEIKRLHSPDVQNLETYKPDSDFGFLLQIIVNPEGVEGEESFDVMVCTPDWFKLNMGKDIQWGRHYLFMKEYDYQKLDGFIEDFVSSISGNDWHEIGQKIGRLGKWEFED